MKDWLDKLSEVSLNNVDEPPKGFLCSKEIAKRRGLTQNGAAHWMRKRVEAGIAQVVNVRRPTANGKVALVPYYGPK